MTVEHTWTPTSRHLTSEGAVIYESCHCGAVRVRLQAFAPEEVVARPTGAPTRAA